MARQSAGVGLKEKLDRTRIAGLGRGFAPQRICDFLQMQ